MIKVLKKKYDKSISFGIIDNLFLNLAILSFFYFLFSVSIFSRFSMAILFRFSISILFVFGSSSFSISTFFSFFNFFHF